MKKYSYIKQDGYKDCGATCVSMIIKHYNGFINMEKIREMTKTTKNGTSAYNIVNTLKEIGFNSYGIKYELNKSATKLILPAIAHTVINNSYYHFVVIYEINYDKEYLIVADPMDKIKKISFNDFNKIFTKNIIIAYPLRKINKEKEISIVSFIKQFFNKKLLFIFLISVILIIFYYLNFVLIKMLLNRKSNLLTLTLLVILIKFLLNNFKTKCMLNYKKKMNHQLMNEIFSDIIDLPYSYYRNRTTGEIVSRIDDISNISGFINLLLICLNNILVISGISIVLYLTNMYLFLITLLIALIYLVNYIFFNKKIQICLDRLKQKNSLLNSYMTESIIGFESIKGQNLKKEIKDKFKQKNTDYLISVNKFNLLNNYMNNINDLITDLSIIIIFVFGLLFVDKNIINFNDLIIYIMLSNYFFEPFKSLSDISILYNDVKISLKRIIELKYNSKNKAKHTLNGNINIDKLNFTKDDKQILNNITLNINKGEKIMMIGHSGCGKSTLLKLIKQYYTTDSIYIDDKKINKINMNDNVTYISQDEYLFTDTLYNNITMYNDYTKEEIDKIIDICELKPIFNDLGLDMLIEENGFNLSGGEAQRIVLARALLHIKDYLLIDEGLSEVDINLERRILKKIFKEYKDKTIIYVSHRKDNLDLFDKLIELDKNNEIKRKGGYLCY